jgi:hypothetical protein
MYIYSYDMMSILSFTTHEIHSIIHTYMCSYKFLYSCVVYIIHVYIIHAYIIHVYVLYIYILYSYVSMCCIYYKVHEWEDLALACCNSDSFHFVLMPFWLVRISMEIDFITHCHVVIY